jgi:surface antigen
MTLSRRRASNMSQANVLPCTRRVALLAGCALTLAASISSAQGNLAFLKDTPFAYFNADDQKLMRAATVEVLQSGQDGTRKAWDNPATGNGGAITLVTQFSAPDGRHCDQLRLESHAKTMENTSIMSVCKSADGRWKLDAAKPPAK